MPVDSKHPEYEDHIDDWKMMRDCDAGERTVKDEGETYLPKPDGFTAQNDKGSKYYEAYKVRAQFPDILMPTLQGMVGVIHRVEAKIEGLDEGKPLNKLTEKCTKDGLPLEVFHQRITSELLLSGRYSVLVDVPSQPTQTSLPYFAGYTAEQLINWSDPDRDLFVLDESTKVRGEDEADEFAWNNENKYRVLRLRDGTYTEQVYIGTVNEEEEITPQVRGGNKLTEIPFVVVNPKEISLQLVQPPLIGVGRAALAIYRLDADYRYQLFSTGQETLFIIGETENLPSVVGAGVVYGLPTGSDAKYVGPTGVGIVAHRQAIVDERQNAVAAGVKLFDTQARAESGEALRLRAAAQTATLTTIAKASAAALEKALRYAAQFAGQDPNEIVVKPNLQFVDTKMTPDEAVKLVTVWQSGAIAKETLYENLQKGEIASPERTFEEEEDLINKEAIDSLGMAAPGGGMAPGKLNGSANLMGAGGPMNGGPVSPGDLSRFIETGDGLQIESA